MDLAETERCDQQHLKRNMDQATAIYISRCDGAPCGDTKIYLFKGADSSANQELRNEFFKSNKSQKQAFKQNKQSRSTFIKDIWEVTHMPSQYVLFLRCCLVSNCPHPLCKQSIEIPNGFLVDQDLNTSPCQFQTQSAHGVVQMSRQDLLRRDTFCHLNCLAFLYLR